ncbi:ABC transporter substrate-binding protein [Telmatospirillum sp. J64-1]|uniref:ABC transporter substrate-binding protein n=1 Tax=Telmatospirillum sp. J64-1 TaxID=2502183 RepID=UPI00115F5571|nr:ABC transporter substrate-binding protein [Telmatospirillum sp. J64-1]
MSQWLSGPRTLAAAVGVASVLMSGTASAEVSEVRLAQQFGLSYLPLIIAKHENLIEKHAREAGLGEIKVTWAQLSGGAATNDALLSGGIDFAAAGIGPVLTIWDKTRGNYDVRGVVALDATPLFLNTNNPNVQSLADFTDRDRIAVPAVKVSIQSVVLQIAAEQAFGEGRHEQLDNLTVSLRHPDATAALLSGGTEITAHFATPPFSFQQLEDPNIHRVLSSYDVLGGPATLNVLYTTAKFRNDNPGVYRAVIAAIEEANEIIASDKARAAEIYVTAEQSNLTPEFVRRIISDEDISYRTTPLNTQVIADFLYRTGSIKTKPESWKDYFFPEVHGDAGS